MCIPDDKWFTCMYNWYWLVIFHIQQVHDAVITRLQFLGCIIFLPPGCLSIHPHSWMSHPTLRGGASTWALRPEVVQHHWAAVLPELCGAGWVSGCGTHKELCGGGSSDWRDLKRPWRDHEFHINIYIYIVYNDSSNTNSNNNAIWLYVYIYIYIQLHIPCGKLTLT